MSIHATSNKPICRWEHNIKMGLRETRWGGMDWFHLVQDMDQWLALVNMVMNLQVPNIIGKFLNS
jgi:hypothetical protein